MIPNERRQREKRGRAAERRAAWALRLKGYRVVARRVRTPAGEIDLVARRANVVAFVEVKARPTLAQAAGSVSPGQRRRIVRAAAHYIAANPHLAALTQRFDTVLVVPRKWPHHVISAWRESGD
jgi:putative endonuclease